MKSSTRNSLLIIVPAYNEEGNIEPFYKEWSTILRYVRGSRILFVYRTSDDATHDTIREVAKKNRRILTILEERPGHGRSILTGYEYAVANKFKYIFQVDSDNQFYAKDFFKLWKYKNTDYFILGHRKKRGDDFHRIIMSRFLGLIISSVCKVRLADYNSPFRLIPHRLLGSFLKSCGKSINYPNILMSIYLMKTAQFETVNVRHRRRRAGKGTIHFDYILKNGYRVLTEIFRYSGKQKWIL